MKVSVWKGGTFGIRVKTSDRVSHFKTSWTDVEIEIGGVPTKFDIHATFWTTCPEFRGKPFTNWFASKGLLSWAKGKPPKLDLIPIGGNKFELQ